MAFSGTMILLSSVYFKSIYLTVLPYFTSLSMYSEICIHLSSLLIYVSMYLRAAVETNTSVNQSLSIFFKENLPIIFTMKVQSL